MNTVAHRGVDRDVKAPSDETISAPITKNLNAYNTIQFWRDWRNLLPGCRHNSI